MKCVTYKAGGIKSDLKKKLKNGSGFHRQKGRGGQVF